MNRNAQLIAKSEEYEKGLDNFLKSVSKLLDNPQIIKALMKADVSGHLHEVRATSGPEALKRYLLNKAKEDPFKFGDGLQLLSYQARYGMWKGSTKPLGDGAGQLGSHRVNPNLKASEPGCNIPTEGFGETPSGETEAQKSVRTKAREILIKSECARHCKKAGRSHCLYCGGIGFEARKALDGRTNKARHLVSEMA